MHCTKSTGSRTIIAILFLLFSPTSTEHVGLHVVRLVVSNGSLLVKLSGLDSGASLEWLVNSCEIC